MFCRIFEVKLCYQIKKLAGYSHLIFNKIVQRQKVDEIFGTRKSYIQKISHDADRYLLYTSNKICIFLMTDFSDVFAR